MDETRPESPSAELTIRKTSARFEQLPKCIWDLVADLFRVSIDWPHTFPSGEDAEDDDEDDGDDDGDGDDDNEDDDTEEDEMEEDDYMDIDDGHTGAHIGLNDTAFMQFITREETALIEQAVEDRADLEGTTNGITLRVALVVFLRLLLQLPLSPAQQEVAEWLFDVWAASDVFTPQPLFVRYVDFYMEAEYKADDRLAWAREQVALDLAEEHLHHLIPTDFAAPPQPSLKEFFTPRKTTPSPEEDEEDSDFSDVDDDQYDLELDDVAFLLVELLTMLLCLPDVQQPHPWWDMQPEAVRYALAPLRRGEAIRSTFGNYFPAWIGLLPMEGHPCAAGRVTADRAAAAVVALIVAILGWAPTDEEAQDRVQARVEDCLTAAYQQEMRPVLEQKYARKFDQDCEQALYEEHPYCGGYSFGEGATEALREAACAFLVDYFKTRKP
jgi:hypothetical protein